MMLDDVHSAEMDRFQLEQDAIHWDTTELEWDDEQAVIAAQYGQRNLDR